jgi:hypothetical protein
VPQEHIKAIEVGIDLSKAKLTIELVRRLRVIEIIEIAQAFLYFFTSNNQVTLPYLIVGIISPELIFVLNLRHVNVIFIATIGSNKVSSLV